MSDTFSILEKEFARNTIFRCVSGSRAYGTNHAHSDTDLRSIFVNPPAAYLTLKSACDYFANPSCDFVYFSLKRFLELAAKANPNVLEILYTPDDCVLKTSSSFKRLQARREIFVTKKIGETHVQYALAQIKKARGKNKWVNNPQPTERPAMEDFFFYIPAHSEGLPCRPIPLKNAGIDLSQYRCARLEQTAHLYRIYHYGAQAKGIVSNGQIVCESIPIEDERPRFSGLLLFNAQAYESAVSNHKNYWTWRQNRNDARWENQERGQCDYDAKNMLHLFRVLYSAKNIFENGAPLVRFSGEKLKFLLDVGASKYAYEKLIEMAEALVADIRLAESASRLPSDCDIEKADALLVEITQNWERENEN